MISDRNIICFASNWFYDPTSKHHVMKLLSQHNHVIWVNYHGSRRPRATAADVGAILGKLRQVIDGPRRVGASMTVVTPMVIPLPGAPVVARLNQRILTRQIRAILDTLPNRPIQLWSFAPDVDYMCGHFGEECVVYYCVDEFSEFSGYDREAILGSERRLLAIADLVVTTSQALFDSKRSYTDNTILLPHGVDIEHFAKATDAETEAPDDIAALPCPRLGFWGLLQDWLDIDLIAHVARSLPYCSIILIGEVATDTASLASFANVHMLGRRSYERLPSYARGFDAALIPFKVNDLTRAVNPIKLREYLSAGLPVVSTPLPEVRRYDGLIEIAESADGFVEACRRAVANVSPADRRRRRDAMRGESWPSKIEELSGHVIQACRVAAETI